MFTLTPTAAVAKRESQYGRLYPIPGLLALALAFCNFVPNVYVIIDLVITDCSDMSDEQFFYPLCSCLWIVTVCNAVA